MNRIGFVVFLASCGAPSTLMPHAETLPVRQHYLDSKIHDSLTNVVQCPDAKLTFVSTDERPDPAGTVYDDFYIAEGCGQRTDFVTMFRVIHLNGAAWTTLTKAMPFPPVEKYRAEAHAQLANTAQFDLGCKDVGYVEIEELIPPLHNAYDAAIGASGCGNRATYRMHCSQTGYTAGTHKISCRIHERL